MSGGFDVIVVGLGAMGSCALAELAARGARVLGLDRFDPPHARGSSHGGSRVIRLSYFEHPDYVPLLRRAYEGFDRLAAECGEPLRHETGLIVGGVAGNAASSGMLRSAREHGLAVEALDGGELMRRYPQFSVPRDWEVVHEAQGGFVRPEATIRAALTRARRHGAHIECRTPVLRWGATDGGVWVEHGSGRVEAGRLVLAGGAWMPELLEGLPLRLQPTRETIVWIDDADDRAWHVGAMPVWLFDRGVEPAIYGIPAFEGMGTPRGMKVGLHGRGPRVRPEQRDEPVDAAVVRETLAVTVECIPGALSRAVVASAHCLYTMSPDADFVIGAHPTQPNVTIACGFSGHGFKFAPVMGEALADLALGGATTLPMGFLSPARVLGSRAAT